MPGSLLLGYREGNLGFILSMRLLSKERNWKVLSSFKTEWLLWRASPSNRKVTRSPRPSRQTSCLCYWTLMHPAILLRNYHFKGIKLYKPNKVRFECVAFQTVPNEIFIGWSHLGLSGHNLKSFVSSAFTGSHKEPAVKFPFDSCLGIKDKW